MAQAQTSTSTLAYVAETTFGVTPVSAAFKELPRTEFSLGLNSDPLTDPTIRADRQTAYSRRGNSSTEGELSVVMRPDNYDELLEAALQGTWTNNALSIGTTERSLAIERGFEFGAGHQFQVFNGVVVNTLSMEINTESLVTATFGLMGTSESAFSATSADAGGYTETVTKDAFYHEGGSFKEGGVEVGFLSSISFELNNNVTGNRALGTTGFRNVTSGKVSVTGSVSGLFESVEMYEKYRANADSSLAFTLVAGVESLEFEFHKIKYTGGGITASGDAGVTVELQFEALYDATAGNTLTITRV